MGATSHTPGPWRAIKAPHGPIDIFDARDRDVVTVYGGGVGQGDREANARLIAAAPELLEELKRLRQAYVRLLEIGRERIIDLGGTCDAVDVMEAGDPALRSAAAAIAKAGA